MMRTTTNRLCCAAVVLSLGLVTRAAEFEANTPYYEDDGWLDITEWFDGNDYNPTDEVWWRWDDEKYDASSDTGTDTDDYAWYGFSGRDDNDWYYDYYDPYLYSYYDYDNNDLFEHSYSYYDFDRDGFYDAYSVSSDWDGDGLYEDYDYYSFSNTGSNKQKQQAQQAKARQSRQQALTGTIEKTKLVQVRGGRQHLVAAIQPQQGQNQQSLVADLGRAEDLKSLNLKAGDKISVKGPRAQVGQQAVLLAQSVELNGQSKAINRSPRTITGKVTDTRKTKIRGQDHLIAMVQRSQDQGQEQKMAVDLGPADRLQTELRKGNTVTFTGFPVKVKGKPLLMAQSLEQGDQFVQINRQSQAMGAAGSTQQGTGAENRKAGDAGRDGQSRSSSTQNQK